MYGMSTADLVQLFVDELRLCRVIEREEVLIFTDAQFPYPEYVGAALAGARVLGAQTAVLTVPSATDISTRLVAESWKAASLVVAMTTISWLYTDAHNEALASGTRTLMVNEPVPALRRLFPDGKVIRRTYAGAKRLAEAKEIRVTDDAGSDFVMRKDGRKGHAQVGISDRPGRWDHWPSGLVACAPLEDSVQGIYVVQPGDVLLRHRRHATTRITLTLEKGWIERIEGGHDAMLLRDYLQSFDDPEAFRIAHAGWGTDHRADWNTIGMDSESMYGNVTVSIGRNMFDGPDEWSGLGGKNYTRAHFDIDCRDKRLYLDGELIVDMGAIIPEDLR